MCNSPGHRLTRKPISPGSGRFAGDAPAYPLLFRVPVLEVKSTTAVKLAELVYPEGHRSPEIFTDGETPYAHFKKFTGKPLVTLNRVGKGAVIYISAPIGREIATRQDPWLKRLVARCITKYAAPLAIEMQSATGIQLVFGRKPGMSVVSLVNHYGGLATGTEERSMPQVGPLRLTVRTPNVRRCGRWSAGTASIGSTATALSTRISNPWDTTRY